MLYNPPTGGAANDPYVGKNVAAGIQGSKVPPGAAEFPQREIVNAISAAGLSPTNSDLTQLTQALMGGGLWVGTFGYTAATAPAGQAATPEIYTAAIPGNVVIPASRAGMRIVGIVPTANATTTPKLAVAGFTAGSAAAPITLHDGLAPAGGDVGVALCAFTLDAAGNWRLSGLAASEINALISALIASSAKGATDQVTYLGDGTIIQRLTYGNNGGAHDPNTGFPTTAFPVTFPMAFPNACNQVLATDTAHAGESACYVYGATSFTNTGFSLFCTAAEGEAFGANIIAIGR